MAFILNTKFNPFTYEELVRPAMEMTAAHLEVEQGIAALEAQAAEWEIKANKETDPRAYALYQNYANDLKMQAANLARRGLTANSRRQLYNMASRYNSDIKPIKDAYDQRQQDRLMLQQARTLDGTMIFSRDASTTSLDDYLANPSLGFESISGVSLLALAASQAAKLATELKSYGKTGLIDAYTDIITAKYGLSKEEIAFAIAHPDDPKANKALIAIVNETLDASGVKNWKNPLALEKAISYINLGLWQAMGELKAAHADNFGAREALNLKHALERIYAEGAELRKTAAFNAALAKKANGKGASEEDLKEYPYNSALHGFISEDDKLAIKKDWDYAIKQGYIKKGANGKLEVTPEGRNAYRNTKVISSDSDLQLNAYMGNNKIVYDKETMSFKHPSGRNVVEGNIILQIDKARKESTKKGQERYGKTFNSLDYDPRWYNMLNKFEQLRTNNPKATAWRASHKYKMGPWSHEEMNILVNNAYGDPKTGYSDLVQHKAVTLNVQDTDYDIIKKDISLNLSSKKIPVFKNSTKGTWELKSDISKEDLYNYTPHRIVVLANDLDRPMIEMFPLRDTKTGNSKEPDYDKAPIYISLPSGGHYSNYRNAVSKYFDNIRVVDDYYITVNKYGNYDLGQYTLEDVSTALSNTNINNPYNILFSAENSLSKALSAKSGKEIKE